MRSSSAVLVMGALCLVGCSAESSGGAGGASGAAGYGGFGGTAGGNSACLTYETRSCTCGSLPGRSVCSIGIWSECLCDGAAGNGGAGGGNGPTQEPPGNKRGDLSWSWVESAPAGGCRPGHYEGSFEGLYASSLTFVGAPIPVAPIDLPGMPGLEFDLVAGSGGGEILMVSGGKMKGNALGLFPFEFDMVGSLDCDTLKFDAELINGFYSLGGVGRFEMEGPITADYDPVTGSMTNGHWIVTEPGSMPPWGSTMPWYGGEGTWRAMFIRP